MRNGKQRAAVLLLTILLTAGLFGCSNEPATESEPFTMTYTTLETDGFAVMAENDRFQLLANGATAEVAVADKQNGAVWYSNPPERENDPVAGNGRYKMQLNSQLMVQYANKAKSVALTNNYVSSIQDGSFAAEKIEDGVRFTFHFTREELVIPVEYRLAENGLRVQVVNADIRETGENRLLTYAVLPYFGCGVYGEDGYLVIPDGSGALMPFDRTVEESRDSAQYRADVYGKDPIFSVRTQQNAVETVSVPVFGIRRPQGSLFAVVEEGDALSTLVADPVNFTTSCANAYFEGMYRGIDEAMLQEMNQNERTVKVLGEKPVSLERYTVYYEFLPPDTDYMDIAAAARDYLAGRLSLTPSAQETVPLYLELTGSVARTASFLGIPYETALPLTDYAEAAACLEELAEAGIDRTVLSYQAWSGDIPFRKTPVKAAASGTLGGKKGLAALLNMAATVGSEVYLSADLSRLYQSGNGLSINTDSVRGLSGGILYNYNYLRSVYRKDINGLKWALVKPGKRVSAAESYVKNLQTYGATGAGDLSIGSLLYSDYHRSVLVKRESLDRQAAMTRAQEALAALREPFGQLLCDAGNAYAWPYATDLTDMPVTSSRYRAFSEDVPFVPALLHGYIAYSGGRINQRSDDETYFLRMVEYGAYPFYSFADTSENTLLNTEYETLTSPDFTGWKTSVIENYQRIQPLYQALLNARMSGHERLTEQVTLTRYDNGKGILVNYADEAFTWQGVTVEGRDFALVDLT